MANAKNSQRALHKTLKFTEKRKEQFKYPAISSDLKWNTHVFEVVRKAASTIYMFMGSSSAQTQILLSFYVSTSPVSIWRRNTLAKFSITDCQDNLSGLGLGVEALQKAGLATLYTRRQELTERLFNEIMENENSDHKIHSLLLLCNSCP